MKIGILTFHRAHNYGAALQAYALQHFLQAQGHEVEFVDYWPKEHEKSYSLIRPLHGSLLSQLKQIAYYTITFWRRWGRIYKFNNFAKNHLSLPKRVRYNQKEMTIFCDYDYVVVGSDQVWRNYITKSRYIGFDTTYYCQTMPKEQKCISYAVSMGIIKMTYDEKLSFNAYLRRFQKILVREQSLAELIQNEGLEAKVVVDPTLLMTGEEWNQLLPANRFRTEKYVLLYQLLYSEKAYVYAQKKAEQLGCILLVMDSSATPLPQKGHIYAASPIEFVHAIRDAEYVVQTSFHGTAFSLIFKKQFITIDLGTNADRVKTLLKSLGVANNYQTYDYHDEWIDYSLVVPRLKQIREESRLELCKAIL